MLYIFKVYKRILKRKLHLIFEKKCRVFCSCVFCVRTAPFSQNWQSVMFFARKLVFFFLYFLFAMYSLVIIISPKCDVRAGMTSNVRVSRWRKELWKTVKEGGDGSSRRKRRLELLFFSFTMSLMLEDEDASVRRNFVRSILGKLPILFAFRLKGSYH